MKKYEKIILTLLLFTSLLCGCSKKQPSEKQVIDDIEGYINSWTVAYDPCEYIYTDIVYDYQILEIDKITLDKSQTEESKYTGWYVVNLKNDNLEGTVYMQVKYQKFDGNKWEIERSEEYQAREAKYIGDINIDSVKYMFLTPIEIDSATVLKDKKGTEASVKITGKNSMGYYIHDDQTSITEDVEFDTVVNLVFDSGSLTWYADNFRIGSQAKTAINPQTIDKATDICVTNILKKADKSKYIGVGDYSLTPHSWNFETERLIENTDVYYQESFVYDLENRTTYYKEQGTVYTNIGFGDFPEAPPFTYRIACSIPEFQGTWNIDNDYNIKYFSGYGHKEATLHVEYPFNGDHELAYISARSIDDTDGTHVINNAYKVTSNKNGNSIEIKKVEIPYFHVDLGQPLWKTENITLKSDWEKFDSDFRTVTPISKQDTDEIVEVGRLSGVTVENIVADASVVFDDYDAVTALLDQKYHGYLANIDDKNYYCIELDADATIQVTFEHPIDSSIDGIGWCITYNAPDGGSSSRMSWLDNASVTAEYELKKGKNYVFVENDRSADEKNELSEIVPQIQYTISFSIFNN